MPNDRFSEEDSNIVLPKPRLIILKEGESIYKPGMKTFLVDKRNGNMEKSVLKSNGLTVTWTVCVCNKVCTCNTQKICTCNTQNSTYTVCKCNKVCSCNPVH